jgi:radical SAM superfamily enzyme YgiQ (UPF0313 family)
MMEAASVAKIAAWARELSPRALVVLGGVTAERSAEARTHADLTIVGPGERTLEMLLRCLKNGNDWRRLDNLIYKEGNTEVRTPLSLNIDPEELPPPDWDLLSPRFSRCFSIEASKGCRYRCSFCADRDLGRQRMRGVDSIVREIEYVQSRLGAELFRFVDSCLTSWPEHTQSLCAAIKRAGLTLEWSCYARIDHFAAHPSLAQAMYAAGCRWVFCGIESGSELILRSMLKGYGKREILQGVRLVRESGLHLHGNFVVGFPGETSSTVDETLDLIDKAGVEIVNFDPLGLPRGSSIEQNPEIYGLCVSPDGWKHASMDLAQARSEVRRCLDRVVHGMRGALPGTESRITLFWRGRGLSERECLDNLRAFRDWHRSDRSSDAAAKASAAAKIRSLALKTQKFISAAE